MPLATLDWERYPNFKPEEFKCRCGECASDGNEMDPILLEALQRIRSSLGEPMHVTSGYRCPKYNAKVSTTGEDGPHTTGKAVDIACVGDKAYKMIMIAKVHLLPITGIGLKQNGPANGRFMHMDILSGNGRDTKGPRPWIWTY